MQLSSTCLVVVDLIYTRALFRQIMSAYKTMVSLKFQNFLLPFTPDGQTALHIASDQHRGKTRKKLSGRQHNLIFNSYIIGRLDMIQTLTLNGAEKSIKDNFGKRPIDLAVSPGT